ncbi:hypothetical protein GCM10011584_32670 [Nocardioides phosphati]|uniref:Glycosyltransferase family 4 protein n=1 Tax=Nocardioides phosphati TaxID=1867775 RepID=A0ABQ2NER8_9ACTN|nr:glycosyltransferase [Nocardioides phosphati]GGO93597.1 hypothetical protein GCM10011584_32670 [Nocardioides phosphati]
MHIVFDGFGLGPGSSDIVVENLLAGWRELAPGDRLTLLCRDEPTLTVPPGVGVERVEPPVDGAWGALWCRSVGVRRAARRLGADGVVSGVTASAFLGARCPRGVIVYDLRHELRPHQFSRSRRLARRLTYAWSFRFADGLFCISHRTADDLVRRHPSTRERVVAASLGADHVDQWRIGSTPEESGPYAVAFGHFANKNVDRVLEAWARFCREEPRWRLRLVGMGGADRAAATERVAELGIADRVELMPWLDDQEFRRCFAEADLVLFPSDFEGFGLPAVEALRLGVPLVISGDAALAEVTGGHAETAATVGAEDIAAAIRRAVAHTPEQREAGQVWTDRFTWSAMARSIRETLVAAGAADQPRSAS